MTGFFTIRRALSVVVLTIAWCGLWQSLSAANILSGVAVSTAVIASGVGTSGRGGIRIVPLVRLGWLVFVDLVLSTVNVAREIITPTDHTEEAIVAVDVPSHGRQHLLFLVVAITLTPGTAVVDADPDTGRLYLHILHADRIAETVEHARLLAELICDALPVPPEGSTVGGSPK